MTVIALKKSKLQLFPKKKQIQSDSAIMQNNYFKTRQSITRQLYFI